MAQENNNILFMKIDIGGGAPVDFTFDSLYLPEREKSEALSRIRFNSSKRPFFHRYKNYNYKMLMNLTYAQVLPYFFDSNEFPKLILGGVTIDKGKANDEVLRNNIYQTLFFLFPTGYPSEGNIRFSCDKISERNNSFNIIQHNPFTKRVAMKQEPSEKQMGIKGGKVEVKQTEKAEEKPWYQNLFSFGNKSRQFSYLRKNQQIYTITEVIWKNDIYNHPVYREFLKAVYQYILSGIDLQKKTLSTDRIQMNQDTLGNFTFTNVQNVRVSKIEKASERVRTELLNTIRSILENVFKFIQRIDDNDVNSYSDFVKFIEYCQLHYIIAEREAEYQKLVNSQPDNSEEKKKLQTYLVRFQKFFSNIIQSKSPNYNDLKQAFIQKNQNIKDSLDRISNYESNEIHEKELVNIYWRRQINDQFKRYLKNESGYNYGYLSSNNDQKLKQIMKSFAIYIFLIEFKQSLKEEKLPPLYKATSLNDENYSSIMSSSSNIPELEPLRNFYNTQYNKFIQDLGGSECTNDKLNAIIYGFMTGENKELSEYAIWYNYNILEDISIDKAQIVNSIPVANPSIPVANSNIVNYNMDDINKRVESKNIDWMNIYTGIREEYSNVVLPNQKNTTKPTTLNRNEYIIHISINAYDKELDQETVDEKRCQLLKETMGPLVEDLNRASISKSNKNFEEKQKKYVIKSILKHVEKNTNSQSSVNPNNNKPNTDKPIFPTGNKPTNDKPTGNKPNDNNPNGDKPIGERRVNFQGGKSKRKRRIKKSRKSFKKRYYS